MHSSQFGKGFFIFLIATSRFPRYSGRVVGCCIGLRSVPLGNGLLQSARHTVPNDPSPTSLMTVKSLGPSRINVAAVVGIKLAAVEAYALGEKVDVPLDSPLAMLGDGPLLPYRGEDAEEALADTG
jgi:hypothetical protein